MFCKLQLDNTYPNGYFAFKFFDINGQWVMTASTDVLREALKDSFFRIHPPNAEKFLRLALKNIEPFSCKMTGIIHNNEHSSVSMYIVHPEDEDAWMEFSISFSNDGSGSNGLSKSVLDKALNFIVFDTKSTTDYLKAASEVQGTYNTPSYES